MFLERHLKIPLSKHNGYFSKSQKSGAELWPAAWNDQSAACDVILAWLLADTPSFLLPFPPELVSSWMKPLNQQLHTYSLGMSCQKPRSQRGEGQKAQEGAFVSESSSFCSFRRGCPIPTLLCWYSPHWSLTSPRLTGFILLGSCWCLKIFYNSAIRFFRLGPSH